MYLIKEEIKNVKKQHQNPTFYFNNKILERCPIETKFLYPLKLYVFDYILYNQTKLYDTKPYIISLGSSKKEKGMFYGINMHNIPFKIRVEFFNFIYNEFKYFINNEIDKFPNVEDSLKQKFNINFNVELKTKSFFNFNVKDCVKKYNIKCIKKCFNINYNLIHFMLLNDENYFLNGTIKNAQTEFLKKHIKLQNYTL